MTPAERSCRHSLWSVAPTNFVCVCVCPAFTVYILLPFVWILIKLCENVGTLVRLIVLKIHKYSFSLDRIMMLFLFFFKSFLSEATLLKGEKNSVHRETIMLRQTVTQATAILLLSLNHLEWIIIPSQFLTLYFSFYICPSHFFGL